MSATPPVPQANQSPYPLQEAKHDKPAVKLPPVMRGGDHTAVDRALPLVAAGAAIGLGAALVGGLVYGLTRWNHDEPTRRKAKSKSSD